MSTWALAQAYGVTEVRMNQLLEAAGLQAGKHILTTKGHEFGRVIHKSDQSNWPILTLWLPETIDYVRSQA